MPFEIAAMPALIERPETMTLFDEAHARAAQAYHRSFGTLYQATPLVSLGALAEALGLKSIHIKDESKRFGLNAFKALGGSYAIGCTLAERFHLDTPTFETLRAAAEGQNITVCTATDGNHGRGVAWTARRLGLGCVVYMPRGSAQERVDNIRAEGARVVVTDTPYDDTVRRARADAEANGWLSVQDTAWPGYTAIPTHIMQGYLTMAREAFEQLAGEIPTHLFLQAGVGSMAGAVAAFFKNALGDQAPCTVIVEPNAADCHYQSALAGDGKMRFVTGDLASIMAGLSCGEPNPISWELLRYCAHFCLSCPDFTAADGMRVLSSPIGSDARIESGESGAATAGMLYELMTRPELRPMRDALNLNESSRVLLVSTEGATDRENYRRVVWEGRYPAPERT